MHTNFILDQRLEASSFKIIDWPLCEVRLKNNKNYPWFILIPRVTKNISEVHELTQQQQMILMQEITQLSQCVKNYFKADKINIGALGNIVSQLHIHVIGRNKNDLSWPHSVWHADVLEENYSSEEKDKHINALMQHL